MIVEPITLETNLRRLTTYSLDRPALYFHDQRLINHWPCWTKAAGIYAIQDWDQYHADILQARSAIWEVQQTIEFCLQNYDQEWCREAWEEKVWAADVGEYSALLDWDHEGAFNIKIYGLGELLAKCPGPTRSKAIWTAANWVGKSGGHPLDYRKSRYWIDAIFKLKKLNSMAIINAKLDYLPGTIPLPAKIV